MCLFFLIHTGSCSRAVLSSKLEGVTMPCSPQCVMSLCSGLLISAKLKGGHPPQRRPQKCVMQRRMPLGRLCWQSLHTGLKLFQPRQESAGTKLITCRRGALPGGATSIPRRVTVPTCHSLISPHSQSSNHPHSTTAPRVHSKIIATFLSLEFAIYILNILVPGNFEW